MIRASAFVVDASVALKWAFDDEDKVDAAVALRDQAIDGSLNMLAPSLWLYEIGNAMVSGVRRGRVNARTGLGLMESLVAVGVRLVDPEPRETYRLALQHGLTGYDASYVALAFALSIPLWSGDRALCKSMGDPEVVRWIGDYPAS